MKRAYEEDDAGGFRAKARDLRKRVRQAVRKESWGRTVVNLAWTAGPVTYFALTGGYYISYGRTPPGNLIIYFAIYTIIAGLLAIALRIGYHVVRGHNLEAAEQALTQVMGQVPDLVVQMRNRLLETYDDANRIVISAHYLLENPDASIEAVQLAVYDLTHSTRLAQTVRAIEVLRRTGLQVRVSDMQQAVADELSQVLHILEQNSPRVAELVGQRFRGGAPAKSEGRVRVEGFIERILFAGENDDYNYMGYGDVEEILTLMFEMLTGREIPMFRLQYSGSALFRDVSVNADRARHEYRRAVFMRNSRLRLLAETLNDSTEVQRVAAAIPSLSSVGEMAANVYRAIESLFAELSRRKIDRNAPADERLETFRILEQFRTVLHLYQQMYRANQQVERSYAHLQSAERRYSRDLEKHRDEFPLKLLRPGALGSGIRIIPRSIRLEPAERHAVALVLEQTFALYRRRLRAVTITAAPDQIPQRLARACKQLGVEIALELDRYLHLNREHVQDAIENSPAVDLAGYDVNLTTEQRIEWARSSVREVQDSTADAVHRLARYLVLFHQVPLQDEDIRILSEEFGADSNILRQIQPEPDRDVSAVLGSPQPQLLNVPPLNRRHSALVEQFDRALARKSVGPSSAARGQ